MSAWVRRSLIAILSAVSLLVLESQFGPGAYLVTVIRERPKLKQRIPPLDLPTGTAQLAIEAAMAKAERPIPVILCRKWAAAPVSLVTTQDEPLDEVLGSLAKQLNAEVSWYVFIDPGSVGRAVATFRCPAGEDPGSLSLGPDGRWSG